MNSPCHTHSSWPAVQLGQTPSALLKAFDALRPPPDAAAGWVAIVTKEASVNTRPRAASVATASTSSIPIRGRLLHLICMLLYRCLADLIRHSTHTPRQPSDRHGPISADGAVLHGYCIGKLHGVTVHGVCSLYSGASRTICVINLFGRPQLSIPLSST